MGIRHLSALMLAGAALAIAWPAEARTVRSERFGIQASFSERYILCPSNFMARGLAVSLTPGNPECRDKGASMHVAGGFNSTYEHSPQESAESLSRYVLENDKTAKIGVKPMLPDLGDRPSATLRIDHADGWTDFFVFAMSAQRNDPDGLSPEDADTAVLTYDAALHTNGARMESDLAVFREFLKSVRFFRGFDVPDPSPRQGQK